MGRRLVLLALAAALAGCGGDEGDKRREAVAEYIRTVNTTQQRFATVYAEADDALRVFGKKGSIAGRSSGDLADAVTTMRDVRGSLAEIVPPAEARTLHAELLRLLDLQTALTLDLSEMSVYLPKASAVLSAAEASRTRMQKALEASGSASAQAAAARTYGKAVGRSLDEFRKVTPPPLLETWHTGQTELLSTSARFGVELADALETGDRAQIERVLARFQSSSRDAAAVARAQLLAVRSFNKRVKTQRALVRKIVQEQRRLNSATT